LDYNAERQVCLNLAETFALTAFFITHRLSTIRHADMILMMDQGSVVEQIMQNLALKALLLPLPATRRITVTKSQSTN